MTTSEIDTGARCEAHVGEVFPPRCADCADLQAAHPLMIPACGYIPGSACADHPDYPLPCARCAREVGTTTTNELVEEITK